MAEFTVTKTYTVDCPRCGNGSVVKVGQRNGHQRLRCKSCGNTFRNGGQAKGRKYDAGLIGATIRDYYMGLSIKQLAESIADRYNVPEPSKDTVYQWISEYTDKATYATKDMKAHTGAHWVVDEMFVQVGGEYCYHWNVLDKRTRYLLATHLSRTRHTNEAIKVLRKALAVAVHPPTRITTDKYIAYPEAIRAVFPKGVKHIRSKGLEDHVNNNMSERMQGIYRHREKTLRGMDCIESGQQLLDGFTLTYNLFRKHSSLGNRTPGEVALVESPFSKWADVVRADVDVPKSWKRKVTERRLGPKVEKKWQKKRGRPRKKVLPEDERGNPVRTPQPHKVQLGFFRKRKPSPSDRRKAEANPVSAPRAVLPDVLFGGQNRHEDRQLGLRIPRPPLKRGSQIRARLRPRTPGGNRK